jgi:hypothetical protein
LKSSSSAEFPTSPVEEETISPRTPVSETVPADPPSGISSVLTEEPSTAEPAGIEEPTEQVVAADEKPSSPVTGSGPLPIDENVPGDETVKSPPHDTSASIAEPTLKVTQADIEVPNNLISETQPITFSSPKKSTETHAPTHVASSIDEAIADFQTAIKTPEPESIKGQETLSATELDATASPHETPLSASQDDKDMNTTTPAVNGHDFSETATDGPREVSATAPRSISTTPVPPAKATSPSQSEQGEGTTLEEIDID